MGGELCINATLALASTLPRLQGEIQLSTTIAQYVQAGSETTIEIDLPYRVVRGNDGYATVLFRGIGYMVGINLEEARKLSKKLPGLCEEYRLPAFGLVAKDRGRIYPTVFVRGTNSLVNETACGSGSVAAYIAAGKGSEWYKPGDKEPEKVPIIQPTGEPIVVSGWRNSQAKLFRISARVERIFSD